MTKVNIEAKLSGRKFYIGTEFKCDISFEVICDNTMSEIEVGLQKLAQLTTAIPELTFTLNDGTVLKARIHNTDDFEEVFVEEEE
ncbi:hypothetical protein HPK19_03390 [Arthrobacter citreus]|nr:hypothetical protein HPK19_03390 [Arthrobacter citreus]